MVPITFSQVDPQTGDKKNTFWPWGNWWEKWSKRALAISCKRLSSFLAA